MDLITNTFRKNPKIATLSIVMSSVINYAFIKKIRQYRHEKQEVLERPLRLVVLTGCDSGLGMSMANWAGHSGYKVLAGCLNLNGEGAEFLRKEFNTKINSNTFRVAQLDVTDEESLQRFRLECEEMLKEDDGRTKLWAVVSNAAILVCGEFFWQTREQIENQMKVNYWGSVNLTLAFKTLLFKHQCRVIFTTSDCADYPFPSLSTYSGSKAALQAWAGSLRHEVSKYGVTVACYQPGNFPQDSQIFTPVVKHLKTMEEAMSAEDQEFYGDYLRQNINIKEEFISRVKAKIEPLNCPTRQKEFLHLLEGNIKHSPVVIHSSFGESVFHSVLAYCPTFVVDKILRNVMDNGAKWEPRKYKN